MVPFRFAFALLALTIPVSALPNAVFGALVRNDSPLNGEDLTEVFLSEEHWNKNKALPGEWMNGVRVANVSKSYLLARPKVLGLETLLVQASRRDGRLEELELTFADAGSFFGYLNDPVPSGLSKREAAAHMRQKLQAKQTEFSRLYREKAEALFSRLESIDSRPDRLSRGRSRDLRAELKVFEDQKSGMSLELLEAPNRLLRLTIRRSSDERETWLDPMTEESDRSTRLKELVGKVQKNKLGDVVVGGVEVVPQGFRPYCGLNSLVMVGGFFGLHLDEDWLSVAGKFQNTGSAAGSDMMGLYGAVAREARFQLKKKNQYDHESVRRAIRSGMPVIVWRRWDRTRDQLHTRISKALSNGQAVTFPDVDPRALPSKEKRSPVHASVIIGYNDERQEVIFLESWESLKEPRRMPVREMSSTSDYLFLFQP
jgi:hypothetical protein